ncbi:MAG TPA: ATP-binding protein [Clostridia bacterium]|nr:ATP-binding protein [Clostridia bacterium]
MEIAALKQLQGEESEHQLRLILDEMADGFVALDRNWRYTHVNPAAAKLLHKSPEELLGRCLWEVFPEAASTPACDNFRRAMRDRVIVDFEEFYPPFETWYEKRCLPTPEGLIVLFRNVTERKQTAGELARVNLELERRVAERTHSLEETTKQLNDFCYSIAHDLRAPIRSQVSFAQILLARHGAQLDEGGRKLLQRIIDAAERQGNLVSDLLAHMSLDRAEWPLEPVNLAQELEKALTSLHLEINQRQAVINTCSLKEWVMANPASLHLVLLNLLSNALKFVPRGKRPEVRIWAETRERVVRLWVQDNGIGIPREYAGKLFGVFQRLHTHEDYPGTGIGLAIVKRAMERMGGQVGFISEAGQGSRFWVEFRPTDRVPA